MLKKVVLGIVFIGLIGFLVAGAINRTLVKSSEGSNGSQEHNGEIVENGKGRKARDLPVNPVNGVSRGKGQGGQGNGAGQKGVTNQGQQNGENQAGSLSEVSHWVQLSGVIASVDKSAMVVQLQGGDMLVVEHRPWTFAQERVFTAATGDEISLLGFFEDETFEVGWLTNNTGNVSIQIWQESGRPLWAGGRNRQNETL